MSESNKMGRSGYFRYMSAGYRAFYPVSLPPTPSIVIEGDLQQLLSEADRAIGALNIICSVLPNPDLLVGMFIYKEALLSSQIEGTQSSLVDVLGIGKDSVPTSDVGEVLNYVAAMRHGMQRIQKGELPLCGRLLKELHLKLMAEVRGGSPNLTPGEFRTMQNWVGGNSPANARFVPPPANELGSMFGELEKYFHVEDHTPPLVQCALIHYQFETLHPFNDGNGRLGRLLISLFLLNRGLLNEPVLYLSAYLKMHQQEYYDRLQQVRTDGSYEKWLSFFLEGIVIVSRMVISTTSRIQMLERKHIDDVVAAGAGKRGVDFVRVLLQQPVIQIKDIVRLLNVSYTKANNLKTLAEDLGILKQISQGKRNRKYSYHEYIEILDEGTDI